MILALLLLPAALAIQVQGRDGPCPVGAGTVRVHAKLSANAAGGYDSDLASYSSGGQWRTYRLSTCSDNGLSLYGDDLLVLTAEDRAKLGAALAAATAEMPATPELWDRYRVAARLYDTLGKSDVFLGDVLLEASWTARDTAVGFYAGLQGPTQARQLLDAGWEELKKPLSVSDRKKVLYNLARVAHRGGWGTERDALLVAFETAGPLSAPEREALARFRRVVTAIEPALQDEAIARYTEALRTELPHAEKVRVSYLLADLLRRRGRDREAAPLYFLVLNDKEAPDQLRGMAMFLVEPIARRLSATPLAPPGK